jgi:hypothetical protein
MSGPARRSLTVDQAIGAHDLIERARRGELEPGELERRARALGLQMSLEPGGWSYVTEEPARLDLETMMHAQGVKLDSPPDAELVELARGWLEHAEQLHEQTRLELDASPTSAVRLPRWQETTWEARALLALYVGPLVFNPERRP